MTSPRHRRSGAFLSIVFVLLLMGGGMLGCASRMSDQARGMMTYQGSFAQLQRAPEEHRGEVVMLGGRIIETNPLPGGTEIIVLQLPLSRSDKPYFDRPSEGRFLVAAPEFLDPAVYEKLTPITIVGEITGRTVRSIGDYAYTLPVLRPIEIKTWPPQYGGGRPPAVHLGIGAGSHGGGAGFGISF